MLGFVPHHQPTVLKSAYGFQKVGGLHLHIEVRASSLTYCGNTRGDKPCRACAIAAICAGVVPQHPPAILSRPE